MDLELLRQVEKPSRYLGGEVNQVRKDPASVRCRVALCYPDVYEIGMSHHGLKILYSVLNDVPDLAAERVYTPWPDMEAALRARGQALSTLESHDPLHRFDVVGFTLQYELSYTNLLTVLDLGGVPLLHAERGREHPVVVAGGPCAFNPEPLAAVLDAVVLGDGEEAILDLCGVVADWRASGAPRSELHVRLAAISGVYVPSLYTVRYHEDGRVLAVEPSGGAPARVQKRVLSDLDRAPFPTREPVPHTQIVHDRYGVEIQRGCMRGCRFCQAGYIYRPERQRRPETIRNLVREGIAATGWDEYSLLSLSVGDYNCIEPLLLTLMDEHEGDRTAVSMPSMRLESLTPGIMDQVGRVRRTSFTVAPEAASERLRAVINKVIDERVLLDMVEAVFQKGWKSLKLYFMLGLPTEQDEDLRAMIDLGSRCLERARRHRRDATITVSVSSFVPKSHTPFQWCEQIPLDEIRRRQEFLRRNLRRAGLDFRFHESRSSVLEGLFGRGDRRIGDLLVRAWHLGARMDGWQEHHRAEVWQQAAQELGIDFAFYNQRRREPDEVLPWDHLSCGVEPGWLWGEWVAALEAGFLADCSEAPCYDCGVCDHRVVRNEVFDHDDPALAARERPRSAQRKGPRSIEEVWVDGPQPPGRRNGPAAPVPAGGDADGPPAGSDGAPPPAAGLTTSPAGPAPLDVRLPTERRQRIRVQFRKQGRATMLSHLEVMAAFQRALKRGRVPILYSAGHHPHMRLQWSPPPPVGVASDAEFCDVEVLRPFGPEVLARVLDGQLPEGLQVHATAEVPVLAPSIEAGLAAWTWRLDAPPGGLEEGLARMTGETLLRPRREGLPAIPADQVLLGLTRLGPDSVRFQTVVHAAPARLSDTLQQLFGTDLEASGWRLRKEAATFGAGAGAT